ncbi:MAG: class I SAM-dependent methyltransferase [Planctomycetes bacterium]|nr:class I SAM-dependent methyltransferase [Planctomycetota bacterium]
MNFTRNYAQRDGYLDFVSVENKSAYDPISSCYDSVLSGGSWIWKSYNRLVWSVDNAYIQTVLGYIGDAKPERFLEAPVGTGLFTADFHQRGGGYELYAVDYSAAMLSAAMHRFSSAGVGQATFIRADIAALPFPDASFDCAVSLNGFHAFPDKYAAAAELARVIAPGGHLACCFYIRGERAITDFWIKNIYQRMGVFIPPFFTGTEAERLFGDHFAIVKAEKFASIMCLHCRRR